MTTRDPRSRDPSRPEAQGQGLDPTQSLSLEAGDDPYEPPHPSLALGTHDVGRQERTKIESPAARAKTPTPAAPRGGPPPIPRGATDEPDRVGSVLGSYKILELLGRGGMGYVFRAEHVKLGREVALKLLRSDYARRRDAVARFFQEARTVNRVRHRNIVDVTDFVELDDGTTFIIMELLRGESLGKWARTGIDLPRALAVLVQICDGLGAAHEVGVIHRDLKPDNVIVVPTTDGAELVKLLDFGVAKLVNRDDEDVGFQTAAGSVIGTPAYMSPEQAGGMAVDARSDIYSLGAIMYELFCGQPMFRGRSFGEYVRKHLTEVPVAPRATPNGAQIDPRLEALIMKCLEKDPIQRFASIHELRDALLSMLGGMETLLPGLASLAASGVRSLGASGMRSLAGANANVGASVTLAPIPQLPAAAIPQLPTIGVPPSGSHASHASQQVYFSQVGPASGIRPPGTPWWVWFVGGAIAVGLGIGAAVWYAGRTGLPSAPAPVAARPPVTQPAPIAEQPAPIAPGAEAPAPSAPPAAAPLVEIRLDSTPEGTVFAEGGATALCRTPCTYSLDPRAGGLPDRRTFVVRSEGYRDASIVVDLQGTQRDFALTLEPLEPPRDEARPAGKAAGRPRVTGRKPIRPRPDAQAGKPDGARPDDGKPDDGKPADARPDDGKAGAPDPAEPADARPPKKKPEPGPIDPADTLDPFRPKSPK